MSMEDTLNRSKNYNNKASFETIINKDNLYKSKKDEDNDIRSQKELDNFNKVNSNIKDIFSQLINSLSNLNSKVNNIEEKIDSNSHNQAATGVKESDHNVFNSTLKGDLKVDVKFVPNQLNDLDKANND